MYAWSEVEKDHRTKHNAPNLSYPADEQRAVLEEKEGAYMDEKCQSLISFSDEEIVRHKYLDLREYKPVFLSASLCKFNPKDKKVQVDPASADRPSVEGGSGFSFTVFS